MVVSHLIGALLEKLYLRDLEKNEPRRPLTFVRLGSSFCVLIRTFNPADYTSEAGTGTGTTQAEVWDTTNNNSSSSGTDGTGEPRREWELLLASHNTAISLQTVTDEEHYVCVPLVAWRNTMEDWVAEEWNEDVSVSRRERK